MSDTRTCFILSICPICHFMTIILDWFWGVDKRILKHWNFGVEILGNKDTKICFLILLISHPFYLRLPMREWANTQKFPSILMKNIFRHFFRGFMPAEYFWAIAWHFIFRNTYFFRVSNLWPIWSIV
jgi:hypothetical protein